MYNIVVINVVVSLLTSYFFGRKYKIGFWYSLIFCLLFGFLIGNIIMLCSPLKTKIVPYKKTTGIQWTKALLCGLASIVCFLISRNFFGQIDSIKRTTAYDFTPHYYDSTIQGSSQFGILFILWGIGFIVLGIYTLDGEAKPKEELVNV